MGIHIKRLQLHNIIKELEETKCVLKSRKPKTDRECNCQEKEDKHTNSDLQNITQKTNIQTVIYKTLHRKQTYKQ
jgi:hypothetical protein